MNDEQELRTKPSAPWIVAGIIGLGVTIWLCIWKFIDDLAHGRTDVALGNGLSVLTIIGTPSGLVTWILWIRRNKRLPSLALVGTVLIGGAVLIFSGAESIGGFLQRPIDWSAAVGGLMQILVLSLPYFLVAWLLWVRPKIGAILLICLGTGLGVWMFIDWNTTYWYIGVLLAGVPIVLGLFTLTEELVRIKQNNQAAGSA